MRLGSREGKEVDKSTYRSLVFIKLVTHVLGEFLELAFDFALSMSTMRPLLSCAPFESNYWCWYLVGDVFDSTLVMEGAGG
jgi:hypothetical protein